jgi:uncharacterized membrane protein YozB (DUF420 family)
MLIVDRLQQGMIDYAALPTVNAILNAVSGVFLLVGYILIRRCRSTLINATLAPSRRRLCF